MNVFSVFQHLQKDKQRKQRHSLKLGKKRRESSKRNYCIISPRVKIKAIIIIHSGHVALPAVLPKVHHRPEPLYGPSVVNTRQVDGLARISGLTQAPYKSHPQPLNSVPRSLTSDSPKHSLSRQSRALSTNTQGSQGERKREGETHERLGSIYVYMYCS